MRLAPIIFFLCALVLRAQTPLGSVTGLATDASGAAVPGVSVTLASQATGVKRAAFTNAAGVYSFPDLPPATYRLTADAKGFRPIETRPFPIEAYRTVRQDLHFEVATATSEVVVTDAAPAAIQVESPSVGGALNSRQLIELPTNLRSAAKNSGDSGLTSA